MRSASITVTAALENAERGWPVMPLYWPLFGEEVRCSCGKPGCRTPGKHPWISEWQNAASTDPDQIREWWREKPESNLGILCGQRAGFFVLDVDGERGANRLKQYYRTHGKLPVGPRQNTGGGGWHLLFEWAPGLKNAVGFADGLDVRTCGGLIVAEPSIHESGSEYEWDQRCHPADMEIPAAPEWLLAEIRKASQSEWQPVPSDEPIGEGKRNATLFRNGCSMRRRGFGEEAIRAALLVENRTRCRPALDDDEVVEIAHKAARYEPDPEEIPKNGEHPKPPARVSDWEEPIPLDAVQLPEFPVDVMPGYLRRMIEATAAATQTPPDLAAMVSLSVLATAAQKRAEALIREGWREVLSLWTVTSLPPGNRKTPAFAPMVAPVQEYEQLVIERMRTEIAEAKTEYEVMEGALKRLKDQAIKAKNQFDRDDLTRQAVQIAQKLEKMPVPKSLRLIADDATPEELGRLLSAQGGRIAIISDEGDVFDMMAGKYSSGKPNIGIYLRAHAGGDVIVDRVGRPDIVIRRAAITFGLCVQPESLTGLTSNSIFKGRGLLGRFLFSLPYSRLGERQIRPAPIPAEVAEEYGNRIALLMAMPADEVEPGVVQPHLIPFTEPADDAVADFERWIEPQLRPSEDLGHMGDWAGKLAGHACRIATLLHLGELAGQVPEPWRFGVEADSFQAARAISEYLIPHAKMAFRAMGSDPQVENARLILRWIKKHDRRLFQKRELFNGMRSRFERADQVDPALVILMEHGYIRQVVQERKQGPGQPPSPTFEVHPSISAYSA